MLDLDMVQRLCDKMTPGPWAEMRVDGQQGIRSMKAEQGQEWVIHDSKNMKGGDVRFVCFASNLLPQAVEEIRYLRRVVEALHLPECARCGKVAVDTIEPNRDKDVDVCLDCIDEWDRSIKSVYDQFVIDLNSEAYRTAWDKTFEGFMKKPTDDPCAGCHAGEYPVCVERTMCGRQEELGKTHNANCEDE